MARTRTLANMRTDVYKRVDLEGITSYVPTTEVDELINQGWARLYGRICRHGSNHFLNSASLTITGGTATSALPSDFYLCKGVDVKAAGDTEYHPIQRFQFEERLSLSASFGNNWSGEVKYDIQGSGGSGDGGAVIRWIPAPATGDAARLWYYPAALRLSANADTFDGGNGWERYAIDWAAAKIAQKEESFELADRINADLAKLEQDVIEEISNRDVGQAQHPRRIRRAILNNIPWRWR